MTAPSRSLKVGLWFPMYDVEQVIYMPTIPVACPRELRSIRDGPRQNIAELGENITTRITKLWKTCNIINQFVRWLYWISCNTERMTPLEFSRYFVTMTQLKTH